MPQTPFIPQNRINGLVVQIAPPVSFHNIVTFIVPVLLTLLLLKYKGNASDSPFEEHPVTFWFATGCLLVYCLVYAVELAEFSGHAQAYTVLVDGFKFLFGSLSMASLASMIFPRSFQPLLYGICIIVSVDRQLLFNTIEMLNSVFVSVRRFLRTATRDQGGILPVSDQQARTH